MARRNKNNVWGSGLDQKGWEQGWQHAAGVPTAEDYQNYHKATHGGSMVGFGAPPMPAPTYDSTYWNELATGQDIHDTGMAGIGLQRGRIGYDTGFGADGQADLSNPYSQAMLLQRHAEQAQEANTNSMAARGQLYSRARQRSADEASFQYERSRSDLQTSAQRGYQGLTLQEQQLGNNQASGKYGAAAGQADRWRQQRLDWAAQYG